MDYIGFYNQHVEDLKKEGRQYKGWCPFHSDRDSKVKGFSVNPDDGVWWCFSCQKGGNTISFCKDKGISIDQAPDYDPDYRVYYYPEGAVKYKLKDKKDKTETKHDRWDGPKDARSKKPYNPDAIDSARDQKRTLWICEGEKDTLTMLEVGQLAIGIPSAGGYKVLNDISFDGILEVIIACDHDQAGEKATEELKDMLSFAKVVVWPVHYPKGYDVSDLREDFERVDDKFIKELRKFVHDDTWIDEADFVDSFLIETEKGRDYIKTGFSYFDDKLDGLMPGGLHVIQGFTSIGKTTFCKQLADQVHEINPELPVFFFALEDSLHTMRAMTFSRLTHATERPIENQSIRKGGDALSPEDYKALNRKKIKDQVKDIYGKDYYLVAGEPDIDVRKIREKVKGKLNRIGKSTALVIVDYLQILPAPKEERLASLMDRIDFNLHELQCLARDINGPVILTSSITKGEAEKAEPDLIKPSLVKGKGSVNILFTPRMLFELIDKGDKEVKGHNQAELHVLKNSEGPKDFPIPFKYYYRYSKFQEPIKLERGL